MRKWMLLFAILGFIGAAIFYSPYIELNVRTGLNAPSAFT